MHRMRRAAVLACLYTGIHVRSTPRRGMTVLSCCWGPTNSGKANGTTRAMRKTWVEDPAHTEAPQEDTSKGSGLLARRDDS